MSKRRRTPPREAAFTVRFKRPRVEKSWRYGRVLDPDGLKGDTVTIGDRRTGGTFVVAREHVEVETRGPRGGLHWTPLEKES